MVSIIVSLVTSSNWPVQQRTTAALIGGSTDRQAPDDGYIGAVT
jgi:hypothetical protein